MELPQLAKKLPLELLAKYLFRPMELPRRGQAMKKLFPAGGGVPLPPVFCPARYQTAGRPPTCDVMRPPRRARSPGRRTLAERLGRGCLHGQAVTTNQRAGGTYQPASVAPRLVRGDDRPPTDRPGGTCPAGFSPGRGEPGLPDGRAYTAPRRGRLLKSGSPESILWSGRVISTG